MSAYPALKNNYFLFYAPDVPNTQRAKHYVEHTRQSKSIMESGRVSVAGALLPDGANSFDEDVRRKLQGSFVVVQAATKEEVLEIIKKDVYYTSGEVWDIEKIVVAPVFLAFPRVE